MFYDVQKHNRQKDINLKSFCLHFILSNLLVHELVVHKVSTLHTEEDFIDQTTTNVESYLQ